ncbi:MAG: flagellar hook-basal body complex protein FliE [Oscillospiraceae bacterium]|nr:flagellar hook-basal body complex protein FliE [Oscillospiraceae bacterium]
MFIVPLSGLSSAEAVSGVSQNHTSASQTGGAAGAFFDIFNDALEDVRVTSEIARQDSYKVATGNVEDVAQVMLNSLQATTALETATQLTSRAVSAYKEIMQMQI